MTEESTILAEEALRRHVAGQLVHLTKEANHYKSKLKKLHDDYDRLFAQEVKRRKRFATTAAPAPAPGTIEQQINRDMLIADGASAEMVDYFERLTRQQQDHPHHDSSNNTSNPCILL